MNRRTSIILSALVTYYSKGFEYYMPTIDGTLPDNNAIRNMNECIREQANVHEVNPDEYLYETSIYKDAIKQIFEGVKKQPIVCDFNYFLIFGRLHFKLELLGRYSLEGFDERITSVFSDMIRLVHISDIEQFVRYVREQLHSNIFFKMNYLDGSQKFRDLCASLTAINNQTKEIS